MVSAFKNVFLAPTADSGTACIMYSTVLETLSGRIEPMVELIHCSHTNQTICWDPIETERSEAPVTPGESMITVTGGSKRPGTLETPKLA